MATARWKVGSVVRPRRPLREVEEMERRFADIFNRPSSPSVGVRLPVEEARWTPAIEVFEKEGRIIVKAELPGVKEEDVAVSVVGDTLTVKGERKAETEVKQEDYYCCERSYGSFFRSISLPSTVDARKIEASYKDGVLKISLPKVTKVEPKKISASTKKKEKASSKRKGKVQ